MAERPVSAGSDSAGVGESVASVRARWVEALRSGRYAQTKEHLRDPGGHCCLGVLCDVVGRWDMAIGDGQRWYFTGLHDGGDGGATVMALVGLGLEDMTRLAHMNDGRTYRDEHYHPHSFAEIADYIESLPLDSERAK